MRHGLKESSVPIIAQYLSTTIEEFLSNDLYSNDSSDSGDEENTYNGTEQNSDPNILKEINPLGIISIRN